MMGLAALFFSGCGEIPRIVVLHDPLSAEEHFRLALAYEQKREFDLALKEYEEVLKKKEFREETYTNMANIYAQQEKADLAEGSYQKAIKANPRYGKAYNNLAWLYLAQNKNLDKAEQLLTEAVEKDPAEAPSYLDTLGSLYEKEGRWEKSLETLKKAETIGFKNHPDQEILFFEHLEKVLLYLGQTDEAEQIHQKLQEAPLHGR